MIWTFIGGVVGFLAGCLVYGAYDAVESACRERRERTWRRKHPFG